MDMSERGVGVRELRDCKKFITSISGWNDYQGVNMKLLYEMLCPGFKVCNNY
jgi:hypothetical protein